jgi:hypothetical protein
MMSGVIANVGCCRLLRVLPLLFLLPLMAAVIAVSGHWPSMSRLVSLISAVTADGGYGLWVATDWRCL